MFDRLKLLDQNEKWWNWSGRKTHWQTQTKLFQDIEIKKKKQERKEKLYINYGRMPKKFFQMTGVILLINASSKRDKILEEYEKIVKLV